MQPSSSGPRWESGYPFELMRPKRVIHQGRPLICCGIDKVQTIFRNCKLAPITEMERIRNVLYFSPFTGIDQMPPLNFEK